MKTKFATMKAKDLKDIISQMDDDLDIAIPYEVHEYWGTLYKRATSAKVVPVQVDGPKNADVMCILIE